MLFPLDSERVSSICAKNTLQMRNDGEKFAFEPKFQYYFTPQIHKHIIAAMSDSHLKQFATLINELKYRHNAPNLDKLLEKNLKDVPVNNRGPVTFRIKCEISRLSKPSLRPIRVEQYLPEIEVFPLKHDDLVHHIEAMTRHELLRQLKLYGNAYTVGVEEHLTNFIKSNSEAIRHAQTLRHLKVTAINISEMIRRREERMYLGVKADIIVLPDSTHPELPIRSLVDMGRLKLSAVTQNVSERGLRLRTQYNPPLGTLCLIRLVGLESEYVFNQPYVLYRCVGSVSLSASAKMPDGDWFRWSLKKIEHYEQGELTDFIQRQIQNNRGRYRVDVDNVEQNVIQQSAEQFITNRDEGFSLYLRDENVVAGFGNLTGQKLTNRFSVGGQNLLQALIEKDSLHLLPYGEAVFWAVLRQNDTFFSAVVSADYPLTVALLQQTVMREGGVIFQVANTQSNPLFAFTTNCLPTESRDGRRADRQRRLTDFYADDTRDLVGSLTNILHIHPLDKDVIAAILPKARPLTESEQKEMSRFCLTNARTVNLPFISARCREQRQEDRFRIDTPIEIEQGKSRFTGKAVDISESGCRIELNQVAGILNGQSIVVRFSKLAPIGTLQPVGKYQVVDVTGTTLRLAADSKSRLSIREYMSHYLDRHFSELSPVCTGPESKFLMGLERALRNLHNSARPNTSALLRFQQSVPRPTLINISGQNQDPLLPYDASTHTESDFYKQWLCHWNMQNGLIKAIRNVTAANPYERRVLLLVKARHQDAILRVDCFEKGRLTPNKIRELTAKLSPLGQVEWYCVDITRKSRVFDRYYREELAYLIEMAPHRGEELDKMIRSTCGVLTVTPITELLSATGVISGTHPEAIQA